MTVISTLLLAFLAHQAPEERIETLEDRIEAQEDGPGLRYDLAETAWRNGDSHRAMEILLALEADSRHPLDLYWLRGHLMEEAGQLEEAETAFRTYLTNEGLRPDAGRGLARVLEAQGRLDAAREGYQKAGRVTRNPDDFLAAAKLAIERDRPLLALRGIEEAIELLGPAISLREAKVEYLRAAKGPRTALVELDALLSLAPKHARWKALRKDLQRDIEDLNK